MRTRKKEKNSGFTLIELAVVIILIGVVFIIVMPRLTGLLSGRKLMGFSRELAGVLDYTRTRAVVDGKVYNFHLDRTKQEYWFIAKEDDDRKASYYSYREEEEVKKPRIRKIPEGISIKRLKLETRARDRYKPVIRFYPRGNSNGAEIYLETEQGDRTVIKVKSYTGKSEVEAVE
ncbi:MAG: prepilin-type N-terminal cleavage/methylation domain-containing protein [Candidatus Auribacterota bacterium]|nr:prepilin-type N-terminal cleavage/methylation domain-containing protein [Candidatus Auribacterota bacterium]